VGVLDILQFISKLEYAEKKTLGFWAAETVSVSYIDRAAVTLASKDRLKV
jgi:hypothetical protein